MIVNFLVKKQGRTGHSGNASLVAVAFSISHTKCQKRGLLEEFWEPFRFFRMEYVAGTF
jgi:hypothetical protein